MPAGYRVGDVVEPSDNRWRIATDQAR